MRKCRHSLTWCRNLVGALTSPCVSAFSGHCDGQRQERIPWAHFLLPSLPKAQQCWRHPSKLLPLGPLLGCSLLGQWTDSASFRTAASMQPPLSHAVLYLCDISYLLVSCVAELSLIFYGNILSQLTASLPQHQTPPVAVIC